MNDLVSRKSLDRNIRLRLLHATTEKITASYDDDRYSAAAWDKEASVWKEALAILEAEPEAYPKPKEGEWISVPGKMFGARCNLCGNRVGLRTDFCCGCGADMRK